MFETSLKFVVELALFPASGYRLPLCGQIMATMGSAAASFELQACTLIIRMLEWASRSYYKPCFGTVDVLISLLVHTKRSIWIMHLVLVGEWHLLFQWIHLHGYLYFVSLYSPALIQWVLSCHQWMWGAPIFMFIDLHSEQSSCHIFVYPSIFMGECCMCMHFILWIQIFGQILMSTLLAVFHDLTSVLNLNYSLFILWTFLWYLMVIWYYLFILWLPG